MPRKAVTKPKQKRASLESPSTPLSWDDYGSAAASASGIIVTRTSSLNHSAFFRGINLLANYIGKLPCNVFKRVGEGKEIDREHPAFKLLRWKPAAHLTSFTFFHTLAVNALVHGNGYCFVERLGDGSPIELLPLNPQVVYPIRVDGVLWYVIEANGEQRKIIPENIIHIRGLAGFDGLEGYSILDLAKDALGLGLGARKFQTVFFKNNARPSVVIEHPAKLSETAQKNLRESWERIHQGLDNSHKVAILCEGMKVSPFSLNAKDSQLIESVQANVREIANFVGVPSWKIGDTTGRPAFSLEQDNQSLLDDSLDPWLVNIECELRDKLLSEEQKEDDSHVIEFNRSALVRADMAARYQSYNTALNGGWMTRNEIRAKENMNPLDGLDSTLTPLNMTDQTGGNQDQAKGLEKDQEEDSGTQE